LVVTFYYVYLRSDGFTLRLVTLLRSLRTRLRCPLDGCPRFTFYTFVGFVYFIARLLPGYVVVVGRYGCYTLRLRWFTFPHVYVTGSTGYRLVTVGYVWFHGYGLLRWLLPRYYTTLPRLHTRTPLPRYAFYVATFVCCCYTLITFTVDCAHRLLICCYTLRWWCLRCWLRLRCPV